MTRALCVFDPLGVVGLLGVIAAVMGCSWRPESPARPERESSPLYAHPGACYQCHGVTPGRGPDRRPEGWKLAMAPRDAVCTSGACHENLATPLKRLHAPLGVGECSVCHVPHSSDRPYLLAGDEASICASCHGGLISCPAATGGSEFGVCSSCHDPHGGAEAFFLRATRPLTASSNRASVTGARGNRHDSQASQGEDGLVR